MLSAASAAGIYPNSAHSSRTQQPTPILPKSNSLQASSQQPSHVYSSPVVSIIQQETEMDETQEINLPDFVDVNQNTPGQPTLQFQLSVSQNGTQNLMLSEENLAGLGLNNVFGGIDAQTLINQLILAGDKQIYVPSSTGGKTGWDIGQTHDKCIPRVRKIFRVHPICYEIKQNIRFGSDPRGRGGFAFILGHQIQSEFKNFVSCKKDFSLSSGNLYEVVHK